MSTRNEPETHKTAGRTERRHVVAWDSAGSGGFDWYESASEADAAFEREKAFCEENANEGWTAYRFDIDVPVALSNRQVTDYIDADLRYFCDHADRRYSVEAPLDCGAPVRG